jgi:2,3-bisphosphoglycerate-independent phosphoglycerate mutase
MKEKALLIILDGYGHGKDYKYNAVTHAKTPFINSLKKKHPHTLLKTDSEAVGLPPKTMGGSEVGHFTIGAGRIVWQSLEEINRSISRGKFYKLPALKETVKQCKKNDTPLHLLGMISDEGVHSHLDHLYALLKFAKKNKLKRIYIHAITDGRDVKERSAQKFIKRIEKWIRELDLQDQAKIATIVGRYYAMDRDTNWNRTRVAYDLLTKGKGHKEESATKAIKNEYTRGTKTDYYLEPMVLDKKGVISKQDSVVFFNYRTDRAAQLADALVNKKFTHFPTPVKPRLICFGPYTKKAPVLFQAPTVKKNLSEILSSRGQKQLRIAETEKYAHVTFFFNSQIKKISGGEKRILIPSPKVASYAEQPEMSAIKVKDALVKELKTKTGKQAYNFIALNFANPDLVGHSGLFLAVKKALATLDKCLQEIVPLALEKGYTILLTADHGNAEYMRYPDGSGCPAHTLNPVPFVLVSNKHKRLRKNIAKKGLQNIAPTILKILKIRKPFVMKGKSLI